MTGSQDYEPDPRNESVLVYVNGELVPRSRREDGSARGRPVTTNLRRLYRERVARETELLSRPT